MRGNDCDFGVTGDDSAVFVAGTIPIWGLGRMYSTGRVTHGRGRVLYSPLPKQRAVYICLSQSQVHRSPRKVVTARLAVIQSGLCSARLIAFPREIESVRCNQGGAGGTPRVRLAVSPSSQAQEDYVYCRASIVTRLAVRKNDPGLHACIYVGGRS